MAYLYSNIIISHSTSHSVTQQVLIEYIPNNRPWAGSMVQLSVPITGFENEEK